MKAIGGNDDSNRHANHQKRDYGHSQVGLCSGGSCIYRSSDLLLRVRLDEAIRRACAVPDSGQLSPGFDPCCARANGGVCEQGRCAARYEPNAVDASRYLHSKCNWVHSLLPAQKSDTSGMPKMWDGRRSPRQFLPALPPQFSRHLSPVSISSAARRQVLRELRRTCRSGRVGSVDQR